MKKTLKHILTSRIIVGGVLLFLQLAIFIVSIIFVSIESRWVNFILIFLSLAMVFWISQKDDNPAYKIPWIVSILLFPLVGGLFYLFWGNTPINRAKIIKLSPLSKHGAHPIIHSVTKEFSKKHPDMKSCANYIDKIAELPVCRNTTASFFSVGERQFASMIENLKKAEKFIFMEYFIIEKGEMWDSILEILTQKAKAGLDIRVMYDDAGCMEVLPKHYFKQLRALGIQSLSFNRFIPTLNTYLNYRDHRKICVIDGNIGYMGGTNLADEYINVKKRYGHWKDSAIILKGEAVASLTTMFLQLWEFASGEQEADYCKFAPTESPMSGGYVQPFCDSPLDNNNVSETVYMKIINNAREYVYITSPYLILDNEMISALMAAAYSGIDVRIITPGVADKWYVHAVTRTFYRQLYDAGIKIYEYTPGFIHSKMILSDDDVAVVGTINMDFRSFYMHFECGTVFYRGEIMKDIKQDILKTLKVSEEISKEWIAANTRPVRSFISGLFRLFSPLM